MDKEISKIDKDYMNSVLIYNKLLKQRNELLKSDDAYKDNLLEVIDEKISEYQVPITRKRKTFLKEIEDNINEFKTSLNDLYEFRINYESSFEGDSKEDILKKYKENIAKDKEKMVTSLGIHKDDFRVYINDNNASEFGSQGEQRFIVLLVKLALVNLVKKRINDCPIVVLDDVFSELDEGRKKEVYEILKSFDQVFITGCDKKDLDGIDKFVSYEIKDKGIKKEEK